MSMGESVDGGLGTIWIDFSYDEILHTRCLRKCPRGFMCVLDYIVDVHGLGDYIDQFCDACR